MGLKNSKIYFLTFCTEGEPFDLGKNLSSNARKIKLLLTPFFDDVIIYTPRTLKECEGSENFCNLHEGGFSLNPGLNTIGCGDFKSFIIDKTLSEIDEGDLLMYHDCNFLKYPQYWQTDWEKIKETCELLLGSNKSDFFAPFESLMDGFPNIVRTHGKRFTTDRIILDPIESELVSWCYEIASSRIIIKNTQDSRDFFSEYLALCKRKDLLKLYPDPNPYPEFTHSCPEQHVLNCLIYKWILDGKLDPSFPRYMFYNRKFRIDDNLMLYENYTLTKYMASKFIKGMVEKINCLGQNNKEN